MIKISIHAVERYCDRINPSVSFAEARSHMLSAMERASRAKEKTRKGEAYYVVPEMRMIVAEEQGTLTVLTVVPPHLAGEDDTDIPDLARELAESYDPSCLTETRQDRKKKEKEASRLEELDRLRAALKKANEQLKRAGLKGSDDPSLLPRFEKSQRQLERQRQHAKKMEDDREAVKAILKDILRCILVGDSWGALDIAENQMPSLVEHLRQERVTSP